MPPSIKDVALRAGVSVGTVSNVMNKPEVVSALTRDRVLAAITDLGFVRNESARSLRVGKSRTVGLVVLDLGNPFFSDLARGAEQIADERGSIVTLCSSGEDSEREQRLLIQFEQQRVQGILISPVRDTSQLLEQIAQIVKRGTPVVLVDRASTRLDRCSVAVDDVMGGRLAAEHLLERGHRRMIFVGGPSTIQQVADRQLGALRVAACQEGAALEVLETSALTLAGGQDAGRALASTPAALRPSGVICANDLIALGLLQEVLRHGVRVPEDLSIVGYDDIAFAEAAVVPLSSVRQPRQQLGREAAKLLLEEIDEAETHNHRHVVFEPELVVRESSDYQHRQMAPLAATPQPAQTDGEQTAKFPGFSGHTTLGH